MNRRLSNTALGQIIFNAAIVIVVAWMFFTYNVGATAPAPNAVPNSILYQGALTHTAGRPVNGLTNITFRLYGTPTGGTALWTEAHIESNAVLVNNGLFNVLLGSLTPIPSDVWDNDYLYLGVQVNNDQEMAPREPIGAVPMAMRASVAAELEPDAIPVFTASTPVEYWQVPQCDSTNYTVPGLTLNVTVDKTSKLLVNFTGLGYSSAARGAIYTRIFIDGVAVKTQSGQSLLSGCRNSPTDGGASPFCTFANSTVQVLEPGNHTVGIRAACDKSGIAKVQAGWLWAMALP